MKSFFLAFCSTALLNSAGAQYATVNFDYEKGSFEKTSRYPPRRLLFYHHHRRYRHRRDWIYSPKGKEKETL